MVDTVDKFVMESMPYFIAEQYKKVMEEDDVDKKIEAALRVYEIGLRTLSLTLVSQYLTRDYDKLSDPALNQMLETKLPFTTLKVWKELFFLGLRAYGGHRDLLFVKELYDFYWDRSVNPSIPRENITEPFDRLTDIRNNIKHGHAPQDIESWQLLCDETMTLLKQILAGFGFFKNYEMIRIKKIDGNRYWFENHTGLEITEIADPIETNRKLGCNWFYLAKDQSDFLKMHPLLIAWEDVTKRFDIAVYDRLSSDEQIVQYQATLAWHKILDETNFFEFFEMLYTTIEFKRGREKYRKLTWWKLKEVAENITNQKMAAVRGKYRRELYLDRIRIKSMFEDFLKSDKAGFVLVGKSGVGKSNFILALADEFHDSKSPVSVLMYDGAQMNPQQSITTMIGQDFTKFVKLGEQENIADIWQEISKVENIDDCKIVLVIDAINENPKAVKLLSEINHLVADSNWPWLKIMITSRPEAWRSMCKGVRLAEDRYYREMGGDNLEMDSFNFSAELEPFSRNELYLAYTNYQKVFNLKSDYDDLHIIVRRSLRDPLLLQLIADIYRDQEIPPEIKPAEVYEKYLDGLIRTKRLEAKDLRFLEKDLMPLMIRDGYYSNSILAKQVGSETLDGGEELYDLIHNEGELKDGSRVNQSFANLVEAGILIWRGSALNYQIVFQYERFSDYHAGKRLFELNNGASDKRAAYQDQILRIQDLPFLWGAVNFALIQELVAGNQTLITNLCRTEDSGIRRILTAVLKEFGQENPKVVLDYLTEFVADKSESAHGVKTLSVDVASTLGFAEILVSVALGSDTQLRIYAVMRIYHLWKNDQREGIATKKNRGLTALSQLAQVVRGPLGLPKANALEAIIGTSIVIFLDQPDDAETNAELQNLWKQVIDDLLPVNSRVGKAFLKVVVGKRALDLFLRFVTFFTKDNLRYNIANLNEVKLFFKLPNHQKQWMQEILPYLDPNYSSGDFAKLENLMGEIYAVDEVLTGAVLGLDLIVQGRKDKETIVPIMKNLFDHQMELAPKGALAVQYIAAALYHLLRVEEELDDETWELVDHFATVPLEKEKGKRGMLVSGAGQEYFSISFLYPPLLYLAKLGQPGMHLWKRYLRLAVEEEDWNFLDDLLYLTGEIAIPFRSPNAAFTILRELLSMSNENVTPMIEDFLVRLRFYYPDMVDDFLDREEFSKQSIDHIYKTTAKESYMQLVFSRFALFVIDGLYSESLLELLTSILDKAVDCSKMSEWVSIVMTELINAIYGEEIFN